MAIEIFVEDVDNLEARDLALNLERHIKQELSRQDFEPNTGFRRKDDAALDLGTILTIVLGAPAIVELAKAVRDWVQLNNGVTININGTVIENIDSKDVADVLRAVESGSQP